MRTDRLSIRTRIDQLYVCRDAGLRPNALESIAAISISIDFESPAIKGRYDPRAD